MYLIISGIVTVFVFAVMKQVGLAKKLGNGLITAICYLGVMLFIVVTFTRSFRKSIK
jgi:hypothetical protein